MLVGEKLASGSKLYTDVWINMAPLSSWTYALLSYLFGRSQLAFEVTALLIAFFQCFLFNRLLLRNKAYNENTYIPGLLYAVLISYFFDFFTLSPFLIGLTFILLALDHIFSHIEVRSKRDEKILNIGTYLGIAALFYFPFIVFLPATLLIFLFFTGTIPRRYLLVLFGFSLPFLLIGCYFLILGRLSDLLYNFIFSPLFYKTWYFSAGAALILFAVPLIYLIISWVTLGQRGRMTNYQSRLSQSMFIWFFFSAIFVIIADSHSPKLYLIFVPVLGYYLGHYFLIFKRKFLAEISFSVLFLTVILLNYGTYFKFFFTSKYIDTSDYMVNIDESKSIKDKKLLVLGENLNPYYGNTMATPFLTWKLSKRVFNNMEYYDNLTMILTGFKEDLPEVIIDESNIMPDILKRIPYLEKRYYKEANSVYILTDD